MTSKDVPKSVRWVASKTDENPTHDKRGRKIVDKNESRAELICEEDEGRMYISYTSPWDPLAKVTFTIEITHLILDIMKAQEK